MRTPEQWERYARVLDWWLAGKTQVAIAQEIGLSRERVRQMLIVAARRLAYRVWKQQKHVHWKWNEERQAWIPRREWDLYIEPSSDD